MMKRLDAMTDNPDALLNAFSDEPPEYCTAVEIVPGVWLGDEQDAKLWGGPRLCVLERPGDYEQREMDRHIPILDFGQILDIDPPIYSDVVARTTYLKQAHQAIDWQYSRMYCKTLEWKLNDGKPHDELLVHCAAGIERSPLVMATWLVKTGRYADIAKAYEFIKSKRPVVQERTHWLESEYLLKMVQGRPP